MPAPYSRLLAVIDETRCIGCTLCIKACPFDAILGSSQKLHGIIDSYCTGCNLCIAPCPVDCISLEKNKAYPVTATTEFEQARKRFLDVCKQRAKLKTARADSKQQQRQQLIAAKKHDLANKLASLKKSSSDS